MPTVAPGVSELRLRAADRQFRAFCFTASADGILVFHAFVKKTQQTTPADVQLGRSKLKEMLDEKE